MRGARYALQRMKNNVKDWLPADFAETTDLEWFARHFAGEQFVVVTWPIPEELRAEGKTLEDDPRFHKLVEKLRAEVAPPEPVGGEAPDDDAVGVSPARRKSFDELSDEEKGELDRIRAREIGDQFGLCTVGDFHENWGGRGEKWLQGDDGVWFFITPNGELYRWGGKSNLVGFLVRSVRRTILRNKSVEGQLITLDPLGQPSTEGRPNEFHADPRKLTARLFKSVTTGPEVRDDLSKENGALWPWGLEDEYAREEARAKALERLSGTLFGPDGKQTCILLMLSEPGKRDLRRVIGRSFPRLGRPRGKLLELAAECGISVEGPEAELKMGGPPVDNVAIDEEGQITLARLIVFSALIGIAVSLICFRSVKITMMIFFVGGVSAITSLGIVWWTGGSVDAILMSMPSLIYVLGLSGAVHIVNYYRDAADENGLEGAPGRGLAHGWKPCTLAAMTTALGLMSLNTSTLVPIEKFGFYSAIGVLATLALLFTFLPSALELWPPNFHKKGKKKGDRQAFDIRQKLLGFWEPVGTWIVRHYVLVTATCAIVFVVGALGLPKIRTCVHLIKLFDGDAKIIRDYEWLEANLASLVPMELVVRVRPEMMRSPIEPQDSDDDTAEPQADEPAADQVDELLKLDFLERVEIADRIQRVLETTFGEEGQGIVGRGMSVPTIAPDLPPPGVSTWKNPTRGVMNRKLEEGRDEYLASSDLLRIDTEGEHKGSELWRISLRLGALMDIDYGQFVSELKRAVEPVLTAYRFRDQILRDIDQQRGGVMKARVAFLGVPDPSQVVETEGESTSNTDEDQSNNEHTIVGEDPSEIDQTRIFTETLRDLMTCSGVYAKRGSWHDPDAVEAEDGYYTSENWGNGLAKAFDCVVLVRDHEHYDIDFIKQHARLFIDARNHVFYPSSETAKTAREKGDSIHVVYTGLVPIVYKAQRELLNSLVASIGWAFAMIALVMMIVLRNGRLRLRNLVNVRAGMLSMIPNVFPIVLIFGAMGHTRILVDIGTMMTASVAMGVAVDDTIHFLTWFRHGIARGLARNEAIIEAYRRCAAAMTQTTLIGGLGLAVFALSTFTPTQYFGVMMLTLLCAALIGDLIFLPALLAGPLGRYFCPPPSATQAAPASPSYDSAQSPEEGVDGDPGAPEEAPLDSDFAKPHMTDAKSHRRRFNYRTDRGHGRSQE
jgi:predicted RND superfamily exporter protein